MKRSSWILLILLAIAIGAYFLIKYQTEIKVSQATETPMSVTYLLPETDAFLTNIRITYLEYNAIELQRNEAGIWEFIFPSQGEADQIKVDAAETQLSSMRVTTDLGEFNSLTDFGLDIPTYTIKVSYSDGSIHRVEVGAKTPTGSGYYVQLDADAVKVVSQYSLDPLLELVGNPPYPATATPETSTPTP